MLTERHVIAVLRRCVEDLLVAAGLPYAGSALSPAVEGFEAMEEDESVWLVFYGLFDEDDPAQVAAWRVREAANYRRVVEALRRAGLNAVVESSPTEIDWIEVHPKPGRVTSPARSTLQ